MSWSHWHDAEFAELDPAQADAHYTLGVTFWQQGEFAASAEELRAAVHAKPDYAEAYYTLGTVLKQKGELAEAATALREAIRLQPQFAGAHTTLATVLRHSATLKVRSPRHRPKQRSPDKKLASKLPYLPRTPAGAS